ncbi:MAG: threonylcarbamoyl-AMP synthase [Dehalococcoidales bacterium]|nr:threonylcarbamoyl-AMP synthase [Dehalococcoidales bacterium]
MAKPSVDIEEQVERGVAILRRGGIVAFPTDTVYGLGVSAYNEPAVKRLYRLKQRPEARSLPILVADMVQMTEVAGVLPPVARKLADSFLPGALTLVLPRSARVPDVITGGKTVAVRIPAHPVAIALIRGLGSPIVGTSANLSGRPSALTAEEVYSQFGDRLGLVIDGGRCPGGRESTIVDVTGEKPRVLREGAISRQQLEQVCPLEG